MPLGLLVLPFQLLCDGKAGESSSAGQAELTEIPVSVPGTPHPTQSLLSSWQDGVSL